MAELRILQAIKALTVEERSTFRFAFPKPPPGPGVEMSASEAERSLLKRLEAEKDKPIEALWQLARFYQQSRQYPKGVACLRQVLEKMPDTEGKARCVLALGQMMESANDFPTAIAYYKEAFSMEPTQTGTWYFINNNLGYSLNQIGRFAEGERYCRAAITVDDVRPNAFKNLGIALAGQGDFRGAVESYIAATRANAADPRAYQLLRELLKQHPVLAFDFQEQEEACRSAVEFAANHAANQKPVVYRGWRKHWLLFCWRVRAWLRMSRRRV